MKEFKLFTLTEYEKEEIYLREMHKKGYEFVRVTMPGNYTFKECEPKDVVYRLDYNPEAYNDKESYIQMFKDAGWEYLQDMNGYSYFRKEASLTNDQENEIFYDAESKLEMLKKIIYTKFIPVLVILIGSFIPNFINFLNTDFSKEPARTFIFIIYFLLVLLGSFAITRVVVGYVELKKKYKK